MQLKRIVSVAVIIGAGAYFAHKHWSTLGPKVEPILEPVIDPIVNLMRKDPQPPESTTSSDLPFPQTLQRTGRVAAPGFLYMLERVSMKTDTGVVAVIPGEEVRIMQRDGKKLRITTGKYDFDVKASQVTADFDLAQAARLRAGIPLQ